MLHDERRIDRLADRRGLAAKRRCYVPNKRRFTRRVAKVSAAHDDQVMPVMRARRTVPRCGRTRHEQKPKRDDPSRALLPVLHRVGVHANSSWLTTRHHALRTGTFTSATITPGRRCSKTKRPAIIARKSPSRSRIKPVPRMEIARTLNPPLLVAAHHCVPVFDHPVNRMPGKHTDAARSTYALRVSSSAKSAA